MWEPTRSSVLICMQHVFEQLDSAGVTCDSKLVYGLLRIRGIGCFDDPSRVAFEYCEESCRDRPLFSLQPGAERDTVKELVDLIIRSNVEYGIESIFETVVRYYCGDELSSSDNHHALRYMHANINPASVTRCP